LKWQCAVTTSYRGNEEQVQAPELDMPGWWLTFERQKKREEHMLSLLCRFEVLEVEDRAMNIDTTRARALYCEML
jgi:hypothetical protein